MPTWMTPSLFLWILACSSMSFFAHAEEETKHPGKPLHLFREALKQAFCQCCTFGSNSPTLFNIEEEYEITDDDDDGVDDEQEVLPIIARLILIIC